MSIATEISRINKAKKDIKNVVNVDFEKITSELVSEYPPKIEELIAQYKSYIPHETTQETTIKAIPLGFKQDIYGNVEQETTSGKNMYEGSQDWSGTWNNNSSWTTDNNTYNGLVVKKRDGQWNGISKNIEVEGGKKYTFSLYVKSDSARPFAIYTSGGTATVSPADKNFTSTTDWQRYSLTFTANSTGTVRLRIENTTSNTGNYTYICGYQLEENSTMTDYEPYTGGIASPNPSFPSKVETLSGYNLIESKATNKSENGITWVVNDDKSIQSNGTSTAFASITVNSSITLPAGTYYLTGCPAGGNTQTYYLDVLNENYSSIAKDLGSGISFTLSSTSIVRIYARVQNGTTMNKIFKPMISTKNGVPYQPYGTIDVKLVGENLFDKDTMVLSGLWYSGGSFVSNNGGKCAIIPVNENTTYVVSRKNSGDFYIKYSVDYPKVGVVYLSQVNNFSNTNNISITTPSNAKYMFIGVSDLTTQIEELQVVKGTTAAPYTPYIEQITNIDLKGNEVLSDDYITIENGRAKLNKVFKKFVLDGSENGWKRAYDSTLLADYFTAEISMDNLPKGTDGEFINVLSDYFIKLENRYELGVGMFSLKRGATSNSLLDIRMSINDITTIDQFKTWLSQNKPVVYYQLATPEVIDLGEVDMKLLEGTNNISVLATMNPTKIETTYYVDKR